MGLSALGVIETAEILSNEYHWIITNPPYLAVGKVCDFEHTWLEENYKNSSSNLATVFVERGGKLLYKNGIASYVIPQESLFQKTFDKYRYSLLKNYSLDFITRLGPCAFQEITGEVVNVILFQFQA